jgi:hypothetical protein
VGIWTIAAAAITFVVVSAGLRAVRVDLLPMLLIGVIAASSVIAAADSIADYRAGQQANAAFVAREAALRTLPAPAGESR